MKLATRESWKNFDGQKHGNDDDDKGLPPYRPVVLSFNTLKEALLARGEMQYLQSTMRYVEYDPQVFDFIIMEMEHCEDSIIF